MILAITKNTEHCCLSDLQFQDRMAEILQSLSNLVQDVKAARGLTQSGCGSILEILEKNAINYQVILTHPSITVMVEQLRPVSPYSIYSHVKPDNTWSTTDNRIREIVFVCVMLHLQRSPPFPKKSACTSVSPKSYNDHDFDRKQLPGS